MLQPRRGAFRRPIAIALAGSAMLIGLGPPASAGHQTVTAVRGSAYGYSCVVSAFGNPCTPPGPTPTVTLAPDASNSPQTASAASARADAGPATIFSSGQLDVSTQGALGPTGSVTSSANIANVNASGQENFTASNLASTCTASEAGVTGSTTITGGTLLTDNGDSDPTNSIPDHPPVEVTLPVSPAPNTSYDGHIHIGQQTDSFRYVFNEQTVNADSSLTVNAAHEYLLGPLATGDLILGQVVCGVTTQPLVGNTPPVAGDDAYDTAYNTALTVPAPGVLANDTDADGGALTAGSASDPAGGSVTLNADGSFTYTPDTGFSGTDSFTYIVTDNQGATDEGTVSVTVAEQPPPPAQADVAVGDILDSPDPVLARGTVTYTIPVTNNGPDAASSVTLLSTLSKGAAFGTAAVDGGDGTECTTIKGKDKGMSCDLGTIAAGATETVTITVTAPGKTGTMTLTSTVSSAGDPDPGNDSAFEDTIVER